MRTATKKRATTHKWSQNKGHGTLVRGCCCLLAPPQCGPALPSAPADCIPCPWVMALLSPPLLAQYHASWWLHPGWLQSREAAGTQSTPHFSPRACTTSRIIHPWCLIIPGCSLIPEYVSLH